MRVALPREIASSSPASIYTYISMGLFIYLYIFIYIYTHIFVAVSHIAASFVTAGYVAFILLSLYTSTRQNNPLHLRIYIYYHTKAYTQSA
jgi:hypothetical protein